ncbi:hypothetical protein Halha_2215 [Halobacteroides halobius DSM 5150]|uniref:Uncharacterized protein n=1 Tax=Halobacteroides halobius (strain ATCC 35273 / DSM 5150 / MD-1) TaxID=748449 RepID=L0KAP8_HALHC|nr:hypothetical protein [Halobacteroides halobius]AGB42091.1 hypothetical protein Halha_2215 [Halobacteroides halobius DSM 5150]
MLFSDKLTELSIGMANEELKEMEASDPEKYDKTLEMIVLMTEIATHFLNESQEFRAAFAKIHAQFLKYPESREVIKESMAAYDDFKQSEEK